jgi:tRNA (cmo5U34)-methyltransferase
MEIGDKIKAKKGAWNFKNINHSKFEQHISQSVPGYYESHNYISFLSDFFLSSGSTVYDIGCSTGNLIAKLSDYNKNKVNIKFIGIEPEKKFKKQFINNISNLKKNKDHKFFFTNKSIQEIKLKECNLAISYYTLQFIHPKFRQKIIDEIYSKLTWGGGFFFLKK